MKLISVLRTLLLGAACLAPASATVTLAQTPARPWMIWDYGTAARCVWSADRKRIADAIETDLKGESSIALQREFDRCAQIEGLAGRPYSRKMFVNALVMQGYQYAARCALKNLTDLSLEEINGLRSAFRKDPANFVLPSAIRSMISICDDRIFHWYANPTSVNAQVLATLVGQRAWIDQLAAWKSDPAHQSPASRLTLCLLEKDETGVVTFVTVLNSLPSGQKESRAAQLLPSLASPCASSDGASPSPEGVVVEITKFYQAHFAVMDER